MNDQITERPKRKPMSKEEIINVLGGEELSIIYVASTLKLADEVLVGIVDGMDPGQERDVIAGLQGLMNIVHEKLMNTWDALGRINTELSVGEDLRQQEV